LCYSFDNVFTYQSSGKRLFLFIIKVMPVISLLKLDNLFVTNNTAVGPYY
jgi:hypothetical protein